MSDNHIAPFSNTGSEIDFDTFINNLFANLQASFKSFISNPKDEIGLPNKIYNAIIQFKDIDLFDEIQNALRAGLQEITIVLNDLDATKLRDKNKEIYDLSKEAFLFMQQDFEKCKSDSKEKPRFIFSTQLMDKLNSLSKQQISSSRNDLPETTGLAPLQLGEPKRSAS